MQNHECTSPCAWLRVRCCATSSQTGSNGTVRLFEDYEHLDRDCEFHNVTSHHITSHASHHITFPPSSVLSLSFRLANSIRHFVLRMLRVWAAAEAAFLVIMKLRQKHLAQRTRAPPIPRQLRDRNADRIFKTLQNPHTDSSPEDFISGWLRDAKHEDIKRDNILEFFAGSLYFKHLNELTEPEYKAVEEYVDNEISRENQAVEYAEGHNVNVKVGCSC